MACSSEVAAARGLPTVLSLLRVAPCTESLRRACFTPRIVWTLPSFPPFQIRSLARYSPKPSTFRACSSPGLPSAIPATTPTMLPGRFPLAACRMLSTPAMTTGIRRHPRLTASPPIRNRLTQRRHTPILQSTPVNTRRTPSWNCPLPPFSVPTPPPRFHHARKTVRTIRSPRERIHRWNPPTPSCDRKRSRANYRNPSAFPQPFRHPFSCLRNRPPFRLHLYKWINRSLFLIPHPPCGITPLFANSSHPSPTPL